MTQQEEQAADFGGFGLSEDVLRAISELGFTEPTPIQMAAIPALMGGRDVVGGARTGSGKTAAFGIPLVERARGTGKVQVLVLTPTRELAIQVSEAVSALAAHTRLRIATIYGGSSYEKQLRALKKGATVVVGTPGRVIDLMDRGSLDLSRVELFVLDEADEMLRMGFLEDVERVLQSTPDDRQIALFSATMPKPIRVVAERYLRDPQHISVESTALSVDHVEQRWIRVPERQKLGALLRILAANPSAVALVFARTRQRCADLSEALIAQGVSVDALHGDLNQGARERVLSRLRSGALNVVVATDVAARGIDVDHLSHVVNYDMPDDPEAYVHRIGRTARAGRSGVAITLITPRERHRARQFERQLRAKIADVSPPSDGEIADARRADVVERLRESLDGVRPSDVEHEYLSDLMWSLGRSEREVAIAALRLLGAAGLELEPMAPVEDEDRFAGVNEVEVVFSVGRKEGMRPGDLVGFLANECGIPGKSIGRVSLGAHRAFVGLPKDAARALLENHPNATIRGQEVTIRPNTHRGGADATDGNTAPGRSGPPGRRKGHKGKRGKGSPSKRRPRTK